MYDPFFQVLTSVSAQKHSVEDVRLEMGAANAFPGHATEPFEFTEFVKVQREGRSWTASAQAVGEEMVTGKHPSCEQWKVPAAVLEIVKVQIIFFNFSDQRLIIRQI